MMLMTQRPDLMNNFRDGVQLRFNTTYVDNDSCVVYGITPDNISLSHKSIKALKKIALNDVRSVGESFAQVAGEKLRKGARHDFVIGSAYYPDYSFHVAEPAQASSLVLVARKYKR